MSDAAQHVVIVGAGHAGGTVAALLRQYGFAGAVTIVGEEPIAPYQRPPLSKAWLKGEADADSLALRPPSFYAEQHIELILNVRVTGVDAEAKTVALADGRSLSYDVLVLATGARARTLSLPGAELDGVMSLRTAADAEVLKAALGPGKRLAVIGGGYIGLEAAASARALGADAVVLEREERILARVAQEPLCSFLAGYHQARGVAFDYNVQVVGFEGENGHVTGVRLGDGRIEPCDVALVAVGLVRNDELAGDAGLKRNHGIVVDEQARTSDPAIFAIGDVAHRPMPHYGRSFWLESVANALEQSKQVACAVVGRPAPPHEVTWNWSDQYDLKLQLAGLNFDGEETVVRGDPATAKFAIFHLKNGVLQSVEAVNAPAEFMAGRQLIASRKVIDPVRLADLGISMKEVAAG